MLQRNRQHLFGRRHFEVQRDIEGHAQPRDVAVGYVPAVFAQMRRDAVRTGFRRQLGRAYRIGNAPPRAWRTVAT